MSQFGLDDSPCLFTQTLGVAVKLFLRCDEHLKPVDFNGSNSLLIVTKWASSSWLNLQEKHQFV